MSSKDSMTIEEGLSLAMQHQAAGRFAEAERIYRQILEVEPNNPAALHLLGLLAHMSGRSDIAIELISSAVTNAPDYYGAHCNSG